MRFDLGPNLDVRDIAKWARTSPAMIAEFYDQTHPQQSVERVAGFRKIVEKTPKDEKERRRREIGEHPSETPVSPA
jgi:hypothetical protein